MSVATPTRGSAPPDLEPRQNPRRRSQVWRRLMAGALVLALVAWGVAIAFMVDPVYEVEGSYLVSNRDLADVLLGEPLAEPEGALTTQGLVMELEEQARAVVSALPDDLSVEVGPDRDGFVQLHVEGPDPEPVTRAMNLLLEHSRGAAERQSYVMVVHRSTSGGPVGGTHAASSLLGVSSSAEPRDLVPRPSSEYLIRVAGVMLESADVRGSLDIPLDEPIVVEQTPYDDAPIMDVTVVGSSRDEAMDRFDRVGEELDRLVGTIEADTQVPPTVRSRVAPVNRPADASLVAEGLIRPFFHLTGLLFALAFLFTLGLERVARSPQPQTIGTPIARVSRENLRYLPTRSSLEPSASRSVLGAPRGERLRPRVTYRADAMSLVILSVWLLFLLPARFVVTPLGGVGQPALLVTMGAAALWLLAKVSPVWETDSGPNPIRWMLGLYLGYLAINFTLLQLRIQTDLEVTSSTRSVMVAASLGLGALLISDACRNRSRLDAIVRAIVYGALVASVVAFLQSFFDLDPPSYLQFPGMSFSSEFDGISERGALNRPKGTMSHAIEMGVVLGAVLPLAIHNATHLSRWPKTAWLITGIIGGAAMLSVARSGILSALTAVALLSLAWSWRQRINAAIAGLGLVAVMWAAVPGLISTFRWFFTNMGTEDSAQARIDRFPLVIEVFQDRPWFGRGTGTFTVEEGLLLDQQLYQTVIELGIAGTLVTVLLLATALAVAVAVWRGGAGEEDKHLALALGGSVAALTLTTVMYTAFWYRVHLSLLFLVIGCLGYLWRTARREAPVLVSTE